MHVVGIITMLIGLPTAVGFQLLVTSCLVFFFRQYKTQGMLQVGFRFIVVLSFQKQKH